jgi:hypothetical protein
MEMSARSVRDGVVLASAYHYFLSFMSLIGVMALIIYGILHVLGPGDGNVAGKLFLPIVGGLFGLILSVLYISIAIGLAQYRNSSRVLAIFLSTMGLMSGFVMVLGSMVVTISGGTVPDWLAISLFGMIAVCLYALFAFMDLFILIFLFNLRVRTAFYSWADEEQNKKK